MRFPTALQEKLPWTDAQPIWTALQVVIDAKWPAVTTLKQTLVITFISYVKMLCREL